MTPLTRAKPNLKREKPAGAFVYESIKHAIAEGTIRPGERLLEQELSARYKVSRTPVREALRILAAERLLADLPGHGLVVAQPSPEETIDVYFLREMLEGLACRLASQRASETDLARLGGIVEEIVRATKGKDHDRLVDLNTRLHFAIWRAARSPRLLKFMEDLQVSVQRFRRSTILYRGRIEQARTEHVALLKAIVERRGDDAERIAREHMRHVRDIRIAMAAREEATTREESER